MPKPSPLAPASFPNLPAIHGVKLAAGSCGLRYKERNDVLLAELAHGSSAAGVFTKSRAASAPVENCRKALLSGMASALLVNSGNANAFTGAAGERSVENIIKAVADLFPCRPSTVFTASTGVIGEPLNEAKIIAALPGLKKSLSGANFEAAAKAIMTTDTFAKGATRSAMIGEAKVTINGIAKGSGMIAPDMATLLAFAFTDAAIPSAALQEMLVEAADRSFNCITVDSDTSTSDTLLLFATGMGAKHRPVYAANDPHLVDFRLALEELMLDLALQVVRDGEGATKLIAITVTGAENNLAARVIGKSIANSPLVKTMVAGEDANWGRIVMAVGKAGEKADRDKLCISIGGYPVAANGAVAPDYDESQVEQHMKGQEIIIHVDVGAGQGKAAVWTCDLTHGYIDINADYRT